MLRLAAARSSRAALPLRRVRGMCAVADPDKIVKDLDVAITDFTTKMENPPPPPDYTVAQIQADAETGSINVSKVGEIFGSHEPEQRKIMMTIASRINELARGIQDTKKNPEWKAAIEEDISNNIWDPSHIPDKIKDSIGPPADKETIAA
ncbi:hypothetical protein EMIHUDRAFT_455074 [Emiliania huxleyi CCMP1516]|uniref:Uncharacterized protein n=2 Tax=Emiliania huxleyi TaxID=2903 RepID=A0A0D3KKS3_EMIH1|nr:hypothetical protein EMIHUDRAFT_455074 [Emiliania huxleyi CCMP1516]EOD36358.1 hypothetical protein EMIHUDRAFT_455074 [Emiliania huxleyi CCMP1516]|eukprot:XP_005788787.1 hypothetical protein EMIHUDRAFT_455074 [Emiliania huxleyi CCMP1516]